MDFTYQQFALDLSTQLGGRYVEGYLTPPTWWTEQGKSVGDWSTYVRGLSGTLAMGQSFIGQEQTIDPQPFLSEEDRLKYGGFMPGSNEGMNYVAQMKEADKTFLGTRYGWVDKSEVPVVTTRDVGLLKKGYVQGLPKQPGTYATGKKVGGVRQHWGPLLGLFAAFTVFSFRKREKK
tara:strand:+ start:962 stop:1492 length:531 start_codon:yes stop_codon:yes gene_type:complete